MSENPKALFDRNDSGQARSVGLAAIAIALLTLASCSGGGSNAASAAKPAAMPAAPVTVAEAIQKTMKKELQEIGTVEAYSTVNVKSQVAGVLKTADFHQGEDVQRGSLLFSIDPRPFEVALSQAKANLARDQAQAEYAQSEAQRYTQLFKTGIVSQDQYDQYLSNSKALFSAVKADEAAVENAQIQLGYCTIRSPIDGRTGALQVNPGNLVENNGSTMVTINKIQPIYVDFSVPQSDLPIIKAAQARRRLDVEAIIPRDIAHPQHGVLTFINNTVDAATGTILMKGTFENPNRELWPGQYVNVTLVLGEEPNAVVVPSAAVQTGQKGLYAYVVKPDHTVSVQYVETGATVNGETAIKKGIEAGEVVVTDGQLRLFPGAKVTIKQNATPATQTTSSGTSGAGHSA